MQDQLYVLDVDGICPAIAGQAIFLQANSVEEMVPVIEDHAAKVHHLELKEEAVEDVRQAIRDVK
jgi:predicted small metal-binding protein